MAWALQDSVTYVTRSRFPDKYPPAHFHARCYRGDARHRSVSKRVSAVERNARYGGGKDILLWGSLLEELYISHQTRIHVHQNEQSHEMKYSWYKNCNCITRMALPENGYSDYSVKRPRQWQTVLPKQNGTSIVPRVTRTVTKIFDLFHTFAATNY